MSEFLKKVFGQVQEFFNALSPGKRLAAGATLVGVVGGVIAMMMWAGESTFQSLMQNLGPEDAANVIRILREKKIPFTVDPSGRNVSVPPEKIYDLRLELATLGLPQSGVVGYEVFDKQNLGTTSFVQKVNQKRALEGELIRTINTMRGVKRSRVHLAIPAKSAFIEDQKKATASVVLDLEAGVVLNEKQVYGIGNLVARAVEGLDINDVVIMNSDGKVISKNMMDPLAAATATQMDVGRRVEEEYEHRIEGILQRIVGEGKVVAKVTAELDFSQVSESQTTFDSEGTAIRSVGKNNQLVEGVRPGPAGLPGAASNVPPGQAGGQAAGLSETRSTNKKDWETVNYEVPQTVRKRVLPSGNVKKIAVAVVVDGKTVKSTDKDGKVVSKVEPWPPEKIKEFETLVATAVGIDPKRGDQLNIRNMEFTVEDFEAAQKTIEDNERKVYFRNMLVYFLIGVGVVLFFVFVVRPFIKWVTENTIDSVDTFLPQTIEELERLQKNATLPGMEEVVPVVPENIDPEKVEGNMLREKIVGLVDANPYKAALVLQEWLHLEKNKEKEKDGKKGAAKGKSA